LQISGFPLNAPSAPQNRRTDIVDRGQSDVEVDVNREGDEDRQSRSLDGNRVLAEDFFQQRVESSRANDSIQFRQQAEQGDLPLNIQKALQTFTENSPSPEQQLGIELVGVDTYA
jgi:hypothetical protein